jgi:hypothetical protein
MRYNSSIRAGPSIREVIVSKMKVTTTTGATNGIRWA